MDKRLNQVGYKNKNLLTLVFITFAFNAQDGSYHNNHYRSNTGDRHAEPGLTVEWRLLQVSILKIKFGRGQNGLLRIYRIRYSKSVVRADPESVHRRWQKRLETDSEVLNRSVV